MSDISDALRSAVSHIEHMSEWIGRQNAGYSFEGLGEDMPTIRAALVTVERLQRGDDSIVKQLGESIAWNARFATALKAILDAEKEFRDNLPDEWEGDPLHDACEAARAIIGGE